MNKIFDQIRNKDLILQPEEIVRQNLVNQMINTLGFPKCFISLEKDLYSLPHLNKKRSLPNRRIDILCFYKKGSTYLPLLMIECKKDKISKKAISQVVGYNQYVKAPFLAIAGKDSIKTIWFDQTKKGYQEIDFLPSYKELLNAIQTK